jgi:cobalt-zinc-cadmium efflux system outer membrane protein
MPTIARRRFHNSSWHDRLARILAAIAANSWAGRPCHERYEATSKLWPCLFLFLLPLAGCQTAEPRKGIDEVEQIVRERAQARIHWNQGTAPDAQVAQAVATMLSRELTAESAVQVALLNNPRLQATYEDLGIAQADVVQAGLLKNPVFDLSVRFPDRSPGKTYLNFSAAEDFIDVFLLPARRKLAAARFEAAKLRVTQEVLDLAAEVKSAFYACQSAEQTAELRRTTAEASAASFDAAKRLHDAGNMNDLDFSTEGAQNARAKIDVTDAEENTLETRERLSALMGLANEPAWKTAGRLPDPPQLEIAPEGLEKLALANRLDLQAARQDVLAQGRALGMASQFRFLPDATLGPDAERETDGQWRIGPTLTVPLPIFDQGQAGIARGQAMLRQSEARYAALAIDVRSQVRSARTRMFHARAKLELYRAEILALAEQQLQQSELHYNAMFIGVFRLLQAKREQIEAGRQYIEALNDYWTARAQLERAVGGKLPPAVQSTTTQATTEPSLPSPAPASQPAHEHHHHHGDEP